MHPAKSVIIFTTLSGLGYGIINMLFLSLLGGHDLNDLHFNAMIFGVIFVSIGLVSSTFHLGHPERAWRALSQWRTSWLSREGVFAIIAYICPILFIGAYFFTIPLSPIFITVISVLGLVINTITIYCTSMIYGSLKPIPAWHNFFTPLSYQLLAWMSGGIFIIFILSLSGVFAYVLTYLVMAFIIMSALCKILYWQKMAKDAATGKARATTASATGLKGRVNLLESPHSADNYLMKEMVFSYARNHARRVKYFALFLGFLCPFICYTIVIIGQYNIAFYGTAAFVLSIIGLFCERWLFFAEAKHAVSLYYGQTKI